MIATKVRWAVGTGANDRGASRIHIRSAVEASLRRLADVTRRLDPYGLKAGKWYLVARDQRGMRTYRLNQILHLTVLAEHFERAEDFDLAGYWAAGITQFRAGLHQGKATIRLSPAGRDRAEVLYNAETVRALRATASPPDHVPSCACA